MPESLGLTTETYNFDDLFYGPYPIVTNAITLESGQNLTRGAVLGQITVGGKYVLSLSAAADGSEVPKAILARDTDASAADVLTSAYVSGDFNENKLTIGTGHTAESIKEGLRDLNIYLNKAKAG